MLALEKLKSRTQKERKTRFLTLKAASSPVGRAMSGHSSWKIEYRSKRVRVRLVVDKVTLALVFLRALLFLLVVLIPSILCPHSYIPTVWRLNSLQRR